MVTRNSIRAATTPANSVAGRQRARSSPGRPTSRRRPRGISLLICLFVVGLTSLMLLGILNCITADLSASRNTADYERALYLAGAGAQHALSELEADSAWRGTIGPIEFPAGSGDTYTATATDGIGGIDVQAAGTAGSTTRRVTLTIQAT